VRAEVAIAELEPVAAAVTAYGLERAKALVTLTPAALRVAEVRERVEHGVDVGTDVQTPVLEVVADVHDRRQRLGRQHAGHAVEQARAAHAARQIHDVTRAGAALCNVSFRGTVRTHAYRS
jgi:hypothetical protein